MKVNAIKSSFAVILAHEALCNTAAVSPPAYLPTVDLGYIIQQATSLNATAPEPFLNFSNIRYAQAPVGPLRFSSPLAPDGPNTTVNNGQQGVICPQAIPAWQSGQDPFLKSFLSGGNITAFTNPTTTSSSMHSALPTPDPRTSEDCLFLDVIVPESIYNTVSAKKNRKEEPEVVECSPCGCAPVPHEPGAPVLFWIYGGGYTFGDKTSFGDPAGLIARSFNNGGEGVIFVALNYRLGLFGWPAGADNLTANAGLLDQRLALKWVQDNIHLFGGDPSRVTVMGESAGGGSIMHHITSHGGRGDRPPFHQAILQSPGYIPCVPEQAQAIFQQTLGNASQVANSSITTLDQLRELPSKVLWDLNTIMVDNSAYGDFTYGPAVDLTPGSYVPDLAIRLISQGAYHHGVLTLVGHNSDEGLEFAAPYVQTQAEYVSLMKRFFPTANSSTIDTITEVLYPPLSNTPDASTAQIERSQIERTDISVADFLIDCNAYSMAMSSPGSYAYYFSVPLGLHAQDVSYTFFNGNPSDDAGTPSAAVSVPFQEFLMSFTINGAPGRPFVPYGSNFTVTNVNTTHFGALLVDPAAKKACEFWEAAPYYVLA